MQVRAALDHIVADLWLPRYSTSSICDELAQQCAALDSPGQDLSLALSLIGQISEEPHRAVMSHGDLSPHNIVLSPEGPAFLDWEQTRCAPAEADVAFITCAANGLCSSG
jgi:thiamine kinase-like enzyme